MNEFALFEFVDGVGAGGRAGGGVAPRVGDVAGEQFAQAGLDEVPRAHVRRFLLAPDDLFRVAMSRHDGLQFLFVKRVKLLDADDGDVLDVAVLAMIVEVEINFSRTEDDALRVLRRGVGDDFLEGIII